MPRRNVRSRAAPPTGRRIFLRRGLAFAAATPLALILEGCTGSRAAPPARAAPPPAPPSASPTPAFDVRDLHGFRWPIAGACLPDGDQLMPNAPRTYRRGFHEGVDFYPGSSCAPITRGTPVLAMAVGTVARADLDYRDLTLADVTRLAANVAQHASTDPKTLDEYRGRQVWIDHGGVVTRYCHLGAIDASIVVGRRVEAGAAVGGVGESGTPESLLEPGTELHLHAEVRVGDGFLGRGLPPAEVRRLYVRLFEP